MPRDHPAHPQRDQAVRQSIRLRVEFRVAQLLIVEHDRDADAAGGLCLEQFVQQCSQDMPVASR